jgi:hypothetical protein
MSRTRVVALAMAVLLVLAGFPALSAADIPDNRVTITDATVSPGTPTAGAPTTVSATVRLSGGSSSAASLERVEIVDGDETLGEATDLGSLSPGETLSVPVTVSFDEPGAYNLSVVATVSDSDDERTTVRRPLTVAVESGAPQIETTVDGLVAGVNSPATVTVSNPTTAALRDITVSFVDADGERVRRTVPTLAAGASETLNFSIRASEPGERSITVETAYTTAAGTHTTDTRERTVTVAELEDDVGVRVERTSPDQQANADGGGGGGLSGIAGVLGGGGGTLQSSTDDGGNGQATGVTVTVTNFGNAPIEDAVLVPRLPNGSAVPELGRAAVADTIAPGESASVTLDLSAVDASSVRFAVGYDLGGEPREVTRPYDPARATGAVSLTGLNVSVDGDRLRLAGNLGNVGDGEVSGVVVAVGESEYAAPAYPQRNYFLGTVGSSEFAPFELTAQVDTTNATSVPIAVSYTTAGERRTETVDVPLPPAGNERRGLLGGFGGIVGLGGFGGTALGAAVGLLVTVPLVVFATRRYR